MNCEWSIRFACQLILKSKIKENKIDFQTKAYFLFTEIK